MYERKTPIPVTQVFLSTSMANIIQDRIDLEIKLVSQEYLSSGLVNIPFAEIMRKAKSRQKIAVTLQRLHYTAKYKNRIRNITTRNNGLISFLPQGQECVLNDRGRWSRVNRVECKSGKFLQKLKRERNYAWLDADIEKFVNYYKSKTIIKGEFQEVSGDTIREWYYGGYYAENTGSLETSCMRGDQCQEYLNIYTENPQVKMIILVNNDSKLVGRALLWNNKYMDRVYGSDDTVLTFANYADEKGYINIYRNKGGNITIKLDETDFAYYPFMDTLNLIFDEGVSNHDSCNLGTYRGIAESTDGDLPTGEDEDEEYHCYCSQCGQGMDEDEGYYIDDESYCGDCVVWSAYEDANSIPIHMATKLYDGEYCYSYNAKKLHNGEWFHPDDDNIIHCDYDNADAEEKDVKYCEYREEHFIAADNYWFTVLGKVVIGQFLDDYLYDTYGFRLSKFKAKFELTTDSGIEAMIAVAQERREEK